MNIPMKDAIRRLRRERDVTQETLADALGVTFQSVSRWETGQGAVQKCRGERGGARLRAEDDRRAARHIDRP